MPKLTLTNLQPLTNDLFAKGKAVDAARRNGVSSVASFAAMAADLILHHSVTLEQVEMQVVATAAAKAPNATSRKAITDKGASALGRNGFPTLGGWVYDLRRINEAGLLGALIPSKGKPAASLSELRKQTAALQPKAKASSRKGATEKRTGKASKAVSVSAAVPVAQAVADALTVKGIADALTAMAKGASFDVLANDEPQVARIVQAAGVLSRIIETGRKEQRRIADEAKAAKLAKAASRKASRKPRSKAA